TGGGTPGTRRADAWDTPDDGGSPPSSRAAPGSSSESTIPDQPPSDRLTGCGGSAPATPAQPAGTSALPSGASPQGVPSRPVPAGPATANVPPQTKPQARTRPPVEAADDHRQRASEEDIVLQRGPVRHRVAPARGPQSPIAGDDGHAGLATYPFRPAGPVQAV